MPSKVPHKPAGALKKPKRTPHNSNVRRRAGKFLAIAIAIAFVAVWLNRNRNRTPTVSNETFDNPVLQTPRHYPAAALNAYVDRPPTEPNVGAPGEWGRPVEHSPDEQLLADQRFGEHAFNIVASEAIALNRSLPDIRSEECRRRAYAERLPNTSVIVVFHNEAWSTLLRTVWSLINRTPAELLHEILLVDDASEPPELAEPLDAYVSRLPVRTRVLRQRPRAGLIQARLLGAGQATGQTLTFLDAHCECTDGWLQPLMARLAEDRRALPSPTIDIISDKTFELLAIGQEKYGGMSTHFIFNWVDVPEREWHRIAGDRTRPLRQPIMAGGLFSVDRQFFYEIGSYDEGMQTWGAENVEISLRVWMCGGSVELLLCSRVGHVYRDHTPYKFPRGSTETITYNARRMANVWLDEYVHVFNRLNDVRPDTHYGDVRERRALRERLQCRDFEWYLRHINPEMVISAVDLFVGTIVSELNGECLDTWKPGGELHLAACHGQGGNQHFRISEQMQFLATGERCWQAMNDRVYTVECRPGDAAQQFTIGEAGEIRTADAKRCLTRVPSVDGQALASVPELRECNGSPEQQWKLLDVSDSTTADVADEDAINEE